MHDVSEDFKRYVVFLSVVSETETTEKLIRAHVQYLRALDLEQRLVLCGPFLDYKGGMIVIKAKSKEEAIALAQKDPFVREGTRTFEVRTWQLSCEQNNHLGMG